MGNAEEVLAQGTTFWRKGRRFGWALALGSVAFITGGVLTLATVPGLLLENWLPDLTGEQRGRLLGPAAQVVLLGLGGIIAVIGVALSLARHRQALFDAAREDRRAKLDHDREEARLREVGIREAIDREREFRGRYVSAAELLSADTAATKRVAGLYALAALADEWRQYGRDDEAQVCVDVLCGYLRAPLGKKFRRTPSKESAVRQTGYNILRERLSAVASGASWEGLRIDLTGSFIDFPVDLSSLVLKDGTTVDLTGAVLHAGRMDLSGVRIHAGGRLFLDGASVRGAELYLNSLVAGAEGRISLTNIRSTEGAVVWMDNAAITDGGVVSMTNAYFAEQSRLFARDIDIRGGRSKLTLSRVRILRGAALSFDGMSLSDDSRFSLHKAHCGNTGEVSLRRIEVGRKSAMLLAIDLDDRVKVPIAARLNGGRLTFGSSVFSKTARPMLDGCEVLPGGEIWHASAQVNERGVVWTGPGPLSDLASTSLGRVMMSGGYVGPPLNEPTARLSEDVS